MFGKKVVDTIEIAEKESTERLGFIQSFISQLEDARDDSRNFAEENKAKIARLEVVVNNCDKVEKFVNKILK